MRHGYCCCVMLYQSNILHSAPYSFRPSAFIHHYLCMQWIQKILWPCFLSLSKKRKYKEKIIYLDVSVCLYRRKACVSARNICDKSDAFICNQRKLDGRWNGNFFLSKWEKVRSDNDAPELVVLTEVERLFDEYGTLENLGGWGSAWNVSDHFYKF